MMKSVSLPRASLSLVLAAMLAVPAAAAPVAAVEKAQAKVTLIDPLTVLKKADMDFGYLTVTGAGTAVLDPNGNSLSTTGGVQAIGGAPTAAVFTAASRGPTLFYIQVPTQPLTLTRTGGSETMTLTNWSLQGSSLRILLRAAAFDFRVGGTLNVNAGQADGFYNGTFDVTIYYP